MRPETKNEFGIMSSRARIIAKCLPTDSNESWKIVDSAQTKQQLKSMNQSTCTHSSEELANQTKAMRVRLPGSQYVRACVVVQLPLGDA